LYKQLTALFARFTAAHLKARGKPQSIYDADGKLVGAIDVVALSDGHIRVAGWACADDIVVHMNGVKASARPSLRRDDVALAHGLNTHLGFDLNLPLGPIRLYEITRFGIEFHGQNIGNGSLAFTLPLDRPRLTQAAIVLKFTKAILGQTPSGIAWLATRNPKYRARIKQGLRLTALPQSRELDPDLFRLQPETSKHQGGITIILPVFNAFELLQDALERVDKNTELPWRLILIEDCSTDSKVLPFLKTWQEHRKGHVILLENRENLGFIGSVNKGIEKALLWSDPVVLLNSDALVPAGWASRLIEPMRASKTVATVTPMSNDAEIFSAPLICQPRPLARGQGDAIDKVAARLNPAAERVAAPTGVGFCMAISLAYLSKIPKLDQAFGRGYGEEVDWCQRARALGGVHVCANNLFVEHSGGQSFGSAEKQRLIARNNLQISARYPAYDNEVQRFVQSDPLRSTRLAMALAWVGTQDVYPVSIYLAHSMGGGAEAYLQSRITNKHHALGRCAVVLRVGGKQRWQLELVTPQGTIAGHTNSLDYIIQLLAPVSRRRIIYSCGVGDSDPAELPSALMTLADKGRHTIEILFHDYFAISPSYTLLDNDGVYRGVPTPQNPDNPAHSAISPNGFRVPLSDWQDTWGVLLDAAKQLVVFSQHSADIVKLAYPAIVGKITIQPHRLDQAPPSITHLPETSRRVVAVLGDIGLQKGAKLMNGLAQELEERGIGLVIVGNFDPTFPIPPSVAVHGSYKLADLAQICARYGVTDWLIPSIWPETYSFTTHEALATGLPVHAFHLGAQGDAVTQAENGFAIPFTKGTAPSGPLRDHFIKVFCPSERAA
jgi:GT2 family glycosyltransferase